MNPNRDGFPLAPHLSPLPSAGMPPDYACTLCKSTFAKRIGPVRKTALVLMFILGSLLVLLGVVALAYGAANVGTTLSLVCGVALFVGAIRRITGKPACPACHSPATVPIFSPAGMAIAADMKAITPQRRQPRALVPASPDADRITQEDAERFRAGR